MMTFDLQFEADDRVHKVLATDPSLFGVRIVLGRPVPGADCEALTRDLEVTFASL